MIKSISGVNMILFISILIIANALSFIGQVSFAISGFFKKKKVIISLQSINHFLCSTAMLLQKAFSGMVQDAVQLMKNIILLFIPEDKKKIKLVLGIICIILGIAIGIPINIYLNGNPWYGYLPIIASSAYSTIVLITFVKEMTQESSELIIKLALVLNCSLWGTYALIVKLYTIFVFNMGIILIAFISIIMIIVKRLRKRLQS